jgi:protein TonB
MRISVLPQKKQNYNCQAFILASLFYIPLVMSSVYVTDYLNSRVVLKSRDNEVRILMRSLEKPPEPEPVKQVTVPAPPPPAEPLPPPEPPAKPEPPKVQPPVKTEPPVKPVPKPKPEKKPPVKPRKEKKIPVVKPEPPKPAAAPQTSAAPVNPAPAAPATSSVSAGSTGSNTVTTMVYGKTSDALMSRIVSCLRSNLYYPNQARARGQQGIVVVSFEIDTGGRAGNIKVVKSSTDSELLKKAAVTTVQNASKTFPKPKGKVRVVVPIEFKLK